MAQGGLDGKGKKKGGARKIGRNAKKCELYRLQNRRLRNKARRLAKRIWGMSNPFDCARRVLHGVDDELRGATAALLQKKGVLV